MDVLFGNRNEFEAFVSSSRRLGYKSPILNGIMTAFDKDKNNDDDKDLDEVIEDESRVGSSRTTVVVTDGPSPVLSFKVCKSLFF